MTLSLDGSALPLSGSELRDCLAKLPSVWVWVDSTGAGWLKAGDAVEVAGISSRSSGLPVVEEAGLAVVAAPGDPRPAIAVAQRVFREHRCWSLLRAPWSTALATRSIHAWRLAEVAWRLGSPIARLLDQLRPAPTVEEAESTQARFYGTPEIAAGYAQNAGEGLSDVEQQIADRWMRPGDRILDVGCGAGREAVGFARRGMRVLAVDASEAATVEARRSARALNLEPGDVSFETLSLRKLDVPAHSFDVVFLASDVYASIPGRANRIAALERARAAVRPGGILIVPADVGGARIARLLLDGPRAVLRACGTRGPDPGDRWVERGPPPTLLFRHGFATEAEVIEELNDAGLDYSGRVSSYVVATRREGRSSPRTFRHASLAPEIVRVLAMLPRVERARRSMGPAPLVALLRRDGARAVRRDPASRARLRQAIGICDRLVPIGGGCYRRSLLEIALDAGAAEEPLFLGLRGREGHAWLQSSAPAEAYDLTFDV